MRVTTAAAVAVGKSVGDSNIEAVIISHKRIDLALGLTFAVKNIYIVGCNFVVVAIKLKVSEEEVVYRQGGG